MVVSIRDTDECSASRQPDSYLGLRIASIFVIMVGSMAGALFPVLARRSSVLNVPKPVFDFAKYFGSGVIIATAFIHLLDPAISALSSSCIDPAWQDYPYALALCMLSIFSIFLVELSSFRLGSEKLRRLGLDHDPHGHAAGGTHAAYGPEPSLTPSEHFDQLSPVSDPTSEQHRHHAHGHRLTSDAMTHILGVVILEFGVILHSVLIGLTLAVDEGFKVLFVVLVFHQTFEGLGLGSRLAFLPIPIESDGKDLESHSHSHKHRRLLHYFPHIAAVAYGLTTPIGIAVGLGVRTTYAPGGPTASVVSGIMDSLSAGVLIYTGLVELLAHEFLFNKEMMSASNGHLAYAIGSMLLGCALMALLGKWA
ncbi:ZIP-like iron-zinc transporter [Fistulina hepatica ATCC 64428]|uniref:ZIP-like iron-zinc transporter n=1 Tax=Fistulina hepatica ATCC 64428 TaxID=1128425 RepID=A0A0D7A4X8_9AGAR|nr:ZIP-like iron-zinc transporter [Fistulina hepatica ATCC 64428]